MLNIKPPDYKYCPLCSNKLSRFREEGIWRKHCTNCGWKYYPHVFQSAAAIVKKDNKILLVKRRRDPYKNTWMFPAGFVKFGEHPEETIKREVEEETNLKVLSTKLFNIAQSIDDPRAPGHLIFEYLATVKGKIKNSDKEENIDIGWFDLKNSPEIGWQQHKEIIKKLQEGEI